MGVAKRELKAGDRILCLAGYGYIHSRSPSRINMTSARGVVNDFDGKLVRWQPDDEARRCTADPRGWGTHPDLLVLIEADGHQYEVSWLQGR